MATMLKFVDIKAKNKRIHVSLWHDEKDNKHAFIVQTKTLQDFKTRKITTTEHGYSVETFFLLHSVFDKFLSDSEISNKILNRELPKENKYKGTANF